MAPQSAPSGPLLPLAREKKAPGLGGYVGSPTQPLLRRAVKPLGEHNRSRNLSPARDAQLREKKLRDKKMPRAAAKKVAAATGIDLTQRFADSSHSPCSLATIRAADVRSPGATPPLDRIREDGSTMPGRDRKAATAAGKSRLRGGAAAAAVKKAIPFPSFEKDGRKERPIKRKELDAHCNVQAKEEDVSSFGTPRSAAKKALVSGRGVAMEGCMQDTSYLLTFDAPMPSPQPSKSLRFPNWGAGVGTCRGGGFGAAGRTELREAPAATYIIDDFDEAPPMPSPLPSKSPGFKKAGVRPEAAGGAAAELQDNNDDVLDMEWFRRSGLACRDSYNGATAMPSPLPCTSPELKRWATAATGGSFATGGRPEEGSNEGTPPPQVTSSPEFLKRGSVPQPAAGGGCFGAGPMMGPEGMQSVRDRRKCKPRGILTIEGDFLSSSGSAEFCEDVSFRQMISVPAMASVEWMVTEGCDEGVKEPLEHTRSAGGSGGRRESLALDVNASVNISPGSFSQLMGLLDQGSAPGAAGEDDLAAWIPQQDGVLDVWSGMQVVDMQASRVHHPLLSDRKRRGLRASFSDFTPPSRWGPAPDSSFIDTMPPDLVALSFAGEDVLCATPEDDMHSVVFEKGDGGGSGGFARGLPPLDRALQRLSLASSMSFSPESSSLDSWGSWHGALARASTGWSRRGGGSPATGSFDRPFQFPPRQDETSSPNTGSHVDEAPGVDTSKDVSPSAWSVWSSDGGSSVVCTPGSAADGGGGKAECTPAACDCKSPDEDVWEINGSPSQSDADELRVGGASLDLMEISGSASGPPSPDSSSEDFGAHRYSRYATRGGNLAEEVSGLGTAEAAGVNLPRRRMKLQQADYSPSTLMRAGLILADDGTQG